MYQVVALVLTLGLVVLLALGVPVGMALAIAGCLGFLANAGEIIAWFQLISMPLKLASSLQNFLLLSIPLFILAAKIMNGSSVTKRIFDFCNVLVGWLPGGLGHANIVASLIFAGMSGTATSDVAGLGQIEIEAMKENGYDVEFSAGVTCIFYSWSDFPTISTDDHVFHHFRCIGWLLVYGWCDSGCINDNFDDADRLCGSKKTELSEASVPDIKGSVCCI